MKRNILLIIILIVSITISGQEIKNNQIISGYFPLPKVDRRIELLSIVFRLAGNKEYNGEYFKIYTQDIHNYFDKYKDHPLVAFAVELQSKDVSYDAVMEMAIHLEQPPKLNPIIPFTDIIPDNRWGQEDAIKFVKLLQQFYLDTDCERFFVEHDCLYKQSEKEFLSIYSALDVNWYNQYYGVQPKGSLNVIVGLGNGRGNYGVKLTYPDNKEDIYAVMGTWYIDSTGNPFYSTNNYLPTLIHEFNHSYVNYLNDKNIKALENSGLILFDLVKDYMKKQAYGDWQTMMNESLVRASVIRYLLKHELDNSKAIKQYISELGNGFFWMKELVEALGYYEENRDKYSTLESYMPVLIAFYNNIARDSILMFKTK